MALANRHRSPIGCAPRAPATASATGARPGPARAHGGPAPCHARISTIMRLGTSTSADHEPGFMIGARRRGGGVRFVLASASPARLRTLRSAGIEPQVIVSGVDESTVDEASAEATCATLARHKAEAVLAQISADRI